jgi:hypothetical protein
MPQSVQIAVSITINAAAPPPLVATPSTVTLPAMTVGVPVSNVPVAVISGGTPPYLSPTVDTSSVAPLPPGLSLAIDSSGNITVSGTPTAAGTGVVTVDDEDSGA